jgi:hypothetical protein
MLGTTMPMPLTYSIAELIPLFVANCLANSGIAARPRTYWSNLDW